MTGEFSGDNLTHEQRLGLRIDTALFDLGVGELFVSNDLTLTAIGKNSSLLEATYIGGDATHACVEFPGATSEVSGLTIVGYCFRNSDTGWRVSELVSHPITHSAEECQYSVTPESVVKILEDICADATLVGRERAKLPLGKRLHRAATKLGAVSLPARTSIVRLAAELLRVPDDVLPPKTDA